MPGPAPEPRPAPPPPHPTPELTLRSPSAAVQVGPARQRPEMQRGAALCLRLWLCLGLLDSKLGELPALPSARLAARGGALPERVVRRRGRGRQAGDRAPGKTGPGARGADTGWSTAGRAWAGRDEERAGGTAPGSGTGLRLHLNAGTVPEDPSICAPSVARLPWSQAGSLCTLTPILRFLTRFHAESGPPAPVSEVVSGRRGDHHRPAADLGAHFPTPPICVRDRSPRGRSGRAPTFPGQGLRGGCSETAGHRRRREDCAEVRVGTRGES